jgi:hypothetical protein
MPAMTMMPTASPAMSRPDVPPLVSAAGVVDGEGAAVVGAAVVGAALVGAAEVGAALVGAVVGLAPA